jgi:hypothetical protein
MASSGGINGGTKDGSGRRAAGTIPTNQPGDKEAPQQDGSLSDDTTIELSISIISAKMLTV